MATQANIEAEPPVTISPHAGATTSTEKKNAAGMKDACLDEDFPPGNLKDQDDDIKPADGQPIKPAWKKTRRGKRGSGGKKGKISLGAYMTNLTPPPNE